MLAPLFAHADSDPRLHGAWGSIKIIGKVCNQNIHKIGYYFGMDGRYEINAQMKQGGGISKQSAKGTYSVKDQKITGKVGGHQVGPFPYRLENHILIIQQLNPACEIHLTKWPEDG